MTGSPPLPNGDGTRTVSATTLRDLRATIFDSAEADTLDRLFDAQGRHDDDAAVWAGWGIACGVIHFFRQARGTEGVNQLLRAMDRVAKAELDRTTSADLRADAS